MPRPRHSHFPTLKRLVGVVVSTGMDRTAVVAIPRLYVHPLTSKIMRHVSKFFCHDHHEICGVGDKVQIKFWGTISRKKRYAVIDMVQRHPRLEGEVFPMSRLLNPPSAAEVELRDKRKAEALQKAAQAVSVGGGAEAAQQPAAAAAAAGVRSEGGRTRAQQLR